MRRHNIKRKSPERQPLRSRSGRAGSSDSRTMRRSPCANACSADAGIRGCRWSLPSRHPPSDAPPAPAQSVPPPLPPPTPASQLSKSAHVVAQDSPHAAVELHAGQSSGLTVRRVEQRRQRLGDAEIEFGVRREPESEASFVLRRADVETRFGPGEARDRSLVNLREHEIRRARSIESEHRRIHETRGIHGVAVADEHLAAVGREREPEKLGRLPDDLAKALAGVVRVEEGVVGRVDAVDVRPEIGSDVDGAQRSSDRPPRCTDTLRLRAKAAGCSSSRRRRSSARTPTRRRDRAPSRRGAPGRSARRRA